MGCSFIITEKWFLWTIGPLFAPHFFVEVGTTPVTVTVTVKLLLLLLLSLLGSVLELLLSHEDEGCRRFYLLNFIVTAAAKIISAACSCGVMQELR